MLKKAQLKRYENSKILHFQPPHNLVREIHTSATSLKQLLSIHISPTPTFTRKILPIKPEISLFFSPACFKY